MPKLEDFLEKIMPLIIICGWKHLTFIYFIPMEILTQREGETYWGDWGPKQAVSEQ